MDLYPLASALPVTRLGIWQHAPMPERPIDPVTLDEAALILGCSPSTVRRRIDRIASSLGMTGMELLTLATAVASSDDSGRHDLS